jgi:hypothetical protein
MSIATSLIVVNRGVNMTLSCPVKHIKMISFYNDCPEITGSVDTGINVDWA